MAWFSYKAVSASGEVVEGELEAADRSAVVERLRSQGHVPIRADELRGAKGLLSGAALGRSGGGVRISGRGRVSAKEVSFLTRELSILLESGLALDRALTILANLSERAALKGVVERVQERVRGGSSLADALEEEGSVFPGFYSGMVRAGEAGGHLEGVLARLAESLERAAALRESVVTALIYPVLVLVLALVSLVILLTLVIPEFRPLFEGSEATLPLLARAVLWLSEALRGSWWLGLLGFAALVVALYRLRLSGAGRQRWDHWVLGLPLFGDLLLKLEVARLTRTLGTLLSNGVSVLNAFSMTVGATRNQAIAAALSDLRGRLAKGEGLARPLAELDLFPGLAVQLIEIGEESGKLEAMLLRVAEIYDDEVKRTIDRLLSLLVPVLMIVLGGVIAVIIGAMLSAILSAYDMPF